MLKKICYLIETSLVLFFTFDTTKKLSCHFDTFRETISATPISTTLVSQPDHRWIFTKTRTTFVTLFNSWAIDQLLRGECVVDLRHERLSVRKTGRDGCVGAEFLPRNCLRPCGSFLAAASAFDFALIVLFSLAFSLFSCRAAAFSAFFCLFTVS